MLTYPHAFELFLQGKSDAGLSERTILFYQNRLQPFIKAMVQKDLTPESVTTENLRAWQTHIMESTKTGIVTKNHDITAIKTFHHWLWLMDYIPTDTSQKFRKPKLPTELIKYLSDDQVKAILNYVYANCRSWC